MHHSNLHRVSRQLLRRRRPPSRTKATTTRTTTTSTTSVSARPSLSIRAGDDLFPYRQTGSPDGPLLPFQIALDGSMSTIQAAAMIPQRQSGIAEVPLPFFVDSLSRSQVVQNRLHRRHPFWMGAHKQSPKGGEEHLGGPRRYMSTTKDSTKNEGTDSTPSSSSSTSTPIKSEGTPPNGDVPPQRKPQGITKLHYSDTLSVIGVTLAFVGLLVTPFLVR